MSQADNVYTYTGTVCFTTADDTLYEKEAIVVHLAGPSAEKLYDFLTHHGSIAYSPSRGVLLLMGHVGDTAPIVISVGTGLTPGMLAMQTDTKWCGVCEGAFRFEGNDGPLIQMPNLATLLIPKEPYEA